MVTRVTFNPPSVITQQFIFKIREDITGQFYGSSSTNLGDCSGTHKTLFKIIHSMEFHVFLFVFAQLLKSVQEISN